ncbi:hypothetical protein [Anaeromassilibacillus sp. An200]|uniref:hypothetical protein n=1 Tax=Anaeromassilibacillus sp. An200 TaxID=1965587 RepID=UPI000B367153|nr:hypothetical protein [Anaeromassilibacillus sp. An200]OUP05500.1 hypothetical protein B5F35_17155 [Anaeromassilibacillus sp. An200]
MHADFYTRESPSQKLGVKYLDDIQLTNSFPDWKALFARIEEQRKIALYASTHYKICDSGRFPQMYDNIYAILGGRRNWKKFCGVDNTAKNDYQRLYGYSSAYYYSGGYQ